MIIVKLKGGLGNQLFQYAFGRNISLRSGKDKLKLDTTSLGSGTDEFRNYSLATFNICSEIATGEEIRKTKYPFGLISKIKNLFFTKL